MIDISALCNHLIAEGLNGPFSSAHGHHREQIMMDCGEFSIIVNFEDGAIKEMRHGNYRGRQKFNGHPWWIGRDRVTSHRNTSNYIVSGDVLTLSDDLLDATLRATEGRSGEKHFITKYLWTHNLVTVPIEEVVSG